LKPELEKGNLMPERKFEYSDAKSHKFWNISIDGASVTTNYGRIGTNGQTKVKELADAAAAEKEYEKLIKQKTGKGYEEVSGAGDDESGGVLKSMMFATTRDSSFVNLSTFIGERVIEYESSDSVKKGHGVYRIRSSWEDESNPFEQKFKSFLESEAPADSTGLVIGNWSLEGPEPSGEIVKTIADSKDLFPNLVAIFFGDVTQEENEISWIENGEMSPLLSSFPNLEMLRIRGGTDLALKKPEHNKLRALGIETGGLAKSVVASLGKSRFPELEHLELWLGTEDYGGDCRVNDLQPILKGELFPKLKYLGLRNSEIVDDICGVIVSSPIINQLETLDLSLGTMTDEGGKALLSLPTDGKLKRLNLQHHFMSPAMAKEVEKLPFTVNVKDRQEPDDWGEGEVRFVAIGE
jgi:predicted DNA-binding WGR domain protein